MRVGEDAIGKNGVGAIGSGEIRLFTLAIFIGKIGSGEAVILILGIGDSGKTENGIRSL